MIHKHKFKKKGYDCQKSNVFDEMITNSIAIIISRNQVNGNETPHVRHCQIACTKI